MSKSCRLIIEYVQRRDTFLWEGYFLASVLFVTSVLKTLGMVHHQDAGQLLSLRANSALTSAIYRKVGLYPGRYMGATSDLSKYL